MTPGERKKQKAAIRRAVLAERKACATVVRDAVFDAALSLPIRLGIIGRFHASANVRDEKARDARKKKR